MLPDPKAKLVYNLKHDFRPDTTAQQNCTVSIMSYNVYLLCLDACFGMVLVHDPLLKC